VLFLERDREKTQSKRIIESFPPIQTNKQKTMNVTDEQIKSQLEFYFGDSNLSKDRFLRQKIEESKDGCKHHEKESSR
jgi:hypothetical protein